MPDMIRISITAAAYDAIASTLPLGSIGYEAEPDEKGQRLIWLEAAVVNRLRAMRKPGESNSDVILRLVEMEAKGGTASRTRLPARSQSPACFLADALNFLYEPWPRGKAEVPFAARVGQVWARSDGGRARIGVIVRPECA
jgi:hypothetical protein